MAQSTVTNLIINPHRSSSLFNKSQFQVVQKPSLVCSSAIKSLASTSSNNHDEILQQGKRRIARKAQRAPRPLVKVSTSDGKWHDKWTINYTFTIRELQLADLAHDGEQDKAVSVALSINKHVGFGFSIEGWIVTSLTGNCSCCFTPFRKEIDSKFNVWVLPLSNNGDSELPEIGGNDPSVIYAKPGSELNLDPLIQDTIQLAVSTKDTCSKFCEKTTPKWQYTDGEINRDQRWSRLSEIKESFGLK